MKNFCLSFAVLLLTGCVGLSPHASSTTVTGLEVNVVKFGIKKGCTDQGLSKGDDPARARNLRWLGLAYLIDGDVFSYWGGLCVVDGACLVGWEGMDDQLKCSNSHQ